ncbi:response regulator [Parablastomonas sp. CN1-191]|uniref:response regulator n=1 Tax=Parablastomonas sp. CN1-191 TaxID=3400908 RepID=UPI003BF8233B
MLTPSDSERSERPRVLVVDDDERNLLAVRTVIEDLAEIETAQSGEEALRHLLAGDFALILLDVMMPGIDGYETAQLIRGREASKRVPIVFLSAVNKEREHQMRGYEMGAVDYVFKPVDPVILRSKVSVFVDLYAMAREIERKAEQEQALLDANLAANTRKLEAERALRLAQEQQGAIIRSLPIALYIEAGDGAERRFVGGDLGTQCGFASDGGESAEAWCERVHPDDRPELKKAIADRADSGAMAVEYRWRCEDETYRYLLDQAVRMTDDDGSIHFAGTLLDVTERRQLESQLLQSHKMDAIGQLTGGIAHDFNNLLAAVLGGMALLERRATFSDDQKKIVDMTRRAAEQGVTLVARLLSFARRQALQPTMIDLAALAPEVSELLTHTLGGLVTLEWAPLDGKVAVLADRSQLELALMNIIINARDAMPAGGTIRVIPRVERLGEGNDVGLAPGTYVVLSVRDQGVGMSREVLEKVTEPFFTTKDVGKGTGLGLSMVHGFALQSGGRIAIESTPDVGTVVDLWLQKAGSGDGGREDAGATVDEADVPPQRILLVDDHDIVRETTAEMLRELGHSVELASDGPTMLRKFADDPAAFDLIITDYAMPKMSGEEMLRRAEDIRAGVPSIIISGYAAEDRLPGALAGHDILYKPFTVSDLRRRIAQRVSAA